MQPPMIGSWNVEVRGVRPFEIHGDRYYELAVSRADDSSGQLMGIKVPAHAAAGVPRAGEKYEITFLMGQVTAARRID